MLCKRPARECSPGGTERAPHGRMSRSVHRTPRARATATALAAALALLTGLGTVATPSVASAQVVVRYRRAFVRPPFRRWFWRVGFGWVLLPPPPVFVYRYGPPPPPPQCPCDGAEQPPPPVAPPGSLSAPPPPPPVAAGGAEGYVIERPRRREQPHVGIGVAAAGFSWPGSSIGGGVAHLRIRSTDHFSWEFALGVLGDKDSMGIVRHDVPLTLGLYFYLWNGVLAPYGVGTAGGNFANEHFMGQELNASQLMAQLGGGLELRLGPHFTVGGDVRFEWRGVVDRRARTPTDLLPPINDEKGAAYNLAATWYF